MIRSTVVTIDGDQAVLLPATVAFPDDVREVEVLKIGQSRVITPRGRRWDDFFLNGPRATEDFMAEYEAPAAIRG